ncbi:MAG: DUF5985 family protein [Bradyrhizobium sp.]|jgi:uncharacterized membrane protein HdeD (DUF308 family)|uniref:DUF5985 family protein n=1 Tax=Bradyrhizobium sp. TaxID=376 RepID=UPI003C7B5F69
MTVHYVASLLMGATAMASFVAMLFFMKFWRRTRDLFFLLFALAFGIDAISRLVLGVAQTSSDAEPEAYLPRLLTFALIVLAIILKNKPNQNRH